MKSRSAVAGAIIMVLSLILWFTLFVIPFIPAQPSQKAAWGAGVFVLAEITFWLAAILLGKEVVQRYREQLNPTRLWARLRNRG